MKRNGFLLALLTFGLLGLIIWNILPPPIQPVLDSAPASVALVSSAAPLTNSVDVSTPVATLKQIYADVSPSVVMIRVANSSQAVQRSRGSRVESQRSRVWTGQGSGFVWNSAGYIVTNNHVVEDANRIAVVFADGTTVLGQVVGTDVDSDLAVVKVDLPAARLKPVELADSSQLNIGQVAIAIGSPFGRQNRMTSGTVTGLERTLPVSEGNVWGPSYVIPDLIQTDAPINPGNSGGVLLDDEGRVIGVTNAIESRTGRWAGVGFAVPSAIVQKVVPALIQSGHYVHPWLGLSGASLDSSLARTNNLSTRQRGALVAEVVPGGPAEKAGLRSGDVIVAIDGEPVQSFDEMVAHLARSTDVDQTVSLTLLRDGQSQNVKVTLAARPSSQASTYRSSFSLP